MADFQKRDPDEVRDMFSGVAKRYDAINCAMCMGLDRLWRRALARAALEGLGAEPRIADFACGSGDVCIELARACPTAKITGVDFCQQMLEIAAQKIAARRLAGRIELVEADCSSTPFEAESFDALTISFGFRNFHDRQKSLSEINRILKPGGRLCILEVSRANRFFEGAQHIFMGSVVPLIAQIFGGRRQDYQYLAKTTFAYPRPEEIRRMLSSAGFSKTRVRKFAFGLVALTISEKV